MAFSLCSNSYWTFLTQLTSLLNAIYIRKVIYPWLLYYVHTIWYIWYTPFDSTPYTHTHTHKHIQTVTLVLPYQIIPESGRIILIYNLDLSNIPHLASRSASWLVRIRIRINYLYSAKTFNIHYTMLVSASHINSIR